MSEATQRTDDPQARILHAADELLAEAGYDGVSMSAVARRAGVNKASVFYYFGSKAALIEQVLERYYAAHLNVLERAFARPGSFAERLRHLIDEYLDFIEDNRRYARVMQQQVAGGGAGSEFARRNLVPLFVWTRKALDEVAPAEGPLSARQMFVTFSGLVINYFTYAPVLAEEWGSDPFSSEALAERRAHVHVVVDALIERLDREFVSE